MRTFPMRNCRRLAIAATCAAVALAAGCSSSSDHPTAAKVAAAPAPPTRPAATTTTQPTAIGLRTNADEQAEFGPDKPLTPAQRQELADQLVIARATAMKYPTVADATKAGYILAGKFTPGAGAHYVSLSGSASSYFGHTTTIDPAHPLALIYEGTAPTSRVVGLMYGSFNVNPPDGFAGPNDHWHRHTNLCVTFGKGSIGIPFPPDSDVQKSACDALHGQFMRETLWMVHAWVVPGWESPQGVFSHANIDLHCADGTDHTDKIGFCTGASA
jgi:hypothetical protein